MTIREATEAQTFNPEAGKFYDGISNEAYHAGPGISSTQLKVLDKWSPLHFAIAPPVATTDAMMLGTVGHAMVLEPDTVESRFIFAPGIDKRTKAGKAKWASVEELAAATGREAVRASEEDVSRAARNVHEHEAWPQVIAPDSSFERSYYWTDDETGVLCKARLDLENRSTWQGGDRILIGDLKFVADPREDAFRRQVDNLGYDFSAAMYRAGVEAVTGMPTDFVWVVVQSSAPFATAIYFPDEDYLELGRLAFRRSLRTLAKCQETSSWPGLGGGKAVMLSPKPWRRSELGEVV